jgi:hypothetical protein
MEQKQFRLYWLGGQTEVIEGKDYPDACKKAGLGARALSVLDFYTEGSNNDYEYSKTERMWIRKESKMSKQPGQLGAF